MKKDPLVVASISATVLLGTLFAGALSLIIYREPSMPLPRQATVKWDLGLVEWHEAAKGKSDRLQVQSQRTYMGPYLSFDISTRI